MSLYRACLYSVLERAIRSIIWMYSLESLVENGAQSTGWQMLGYFFATGGILLFRYLVCSQRHIQAYQIGFQKKYQTLTHYHNKWLTSDDKTSDDTSISSQYHYHLQQLADTVEQSTTRIAIDLVPGIASVCIGGIQLWRYIKQPGLSYCLLYLCFIEACYSFLEQYHLKKDDVYHRQVQKSKSLVSQTSGEAIQNKELIAQYQKTGYELQQLSRLGESQQYIEMAKTRVFNLLNSIVHWISYLVYLGVMVLSSHYLEKSTHIMWVIYFAKEIRSGWQEIHNYYAFQRKETSIQSTLEQLLKKPMPLETTNHTQIKDSSTINIQNFTFYRGKKLLFDNLSFSTDSFQKNKITVILGKNGTGKSTLCRIFARSLTNIKLSSDGCFQSPPMTRTLMCEQSPLLFESKSVLYNIAYGTDDIYDDTYIQKIEYYREVAKHLEMDHLLESTCSKLSGGERQKTCLLRAYLSCIQKKKEVDLLLLDEWDSHLDVESRQRGFRLIQEIMETTGCTVVWVSHNYIPELGTSARAVILESNQVIEGDYADIWNLHLENQK